MKLKIVTQNVMCWETDGGEHPKRRERMKRLFSRLDPDLIGAQEVTDRWRDYLEEDLPGYGSVFRFRGKDDHEATPLYYKKDTLKTASRRATRACSGFPKRLKSSLADPERDV